MASILQLVHDSIFGNHSRLCKPRMFETPASFRHFSLEMKAQVVSSVVADENVRKSFKLIDSATKLHGHESHLSVNWDML